MNSKIYANSITLMVIITHSVTIVREAKLYHVTDREYIQELATATGMLMPDEELIKKMCKDMNPALGNPEDFKELPVPEGSNVSDVVFGFAESIPDEKLAEPFEWNPPDDTREMTKGIMVDEKNGVALIKDARTVELVSLAKDGKRGKDVIFSRSHAEGSETVDQCLPCIQNQMVKEGRPFDFELVEKPIEEYPEIFAEKQE